MPHRHTQPSLRRTALRVAAAALVLSACRDQAVPTAPGTAPAPAVDRSAWQNRIIPAPKQLGARHTALALSNAALASCGSASFPLGDNAYTIGHVKVSNDEQALYVTYTANATHWWISDTRLAVSKTRAGIPVDASGQPEPWSFPYAGEHEPVITSYAYKIPFGDLGLAAGQTVYVSAMAGAVHPVDTLNYSGAWEWRVLWALEAPRGMQKIHTYTIAGCGGTTPPPPPPPPTSAAYITITFDDGWLDTYTNAYPVLKEFGLIGNVAVNPVAVDGQWTGYMRLHHLKELKAAGWGVISHTMSHEDLTTLSDAQLDYELRASKEWIQNNGFGPADAFAVPFHSWGSRERAAIQKYYSRVRGYTVTQFWPEKWVAMPWTQPYDLTGLEPEYMPFTTVEGRAATMEYVQTAVQNGYFLDLFFHHITTSQVPAFRELMRQVAQYKQYVKSW